MFNGDVSASGNLSCNYTISHFFCIFSDVQVEQNLRLIAKNFFGDKAQPIYFSGFQESLPNLLLLIFAVLVTMQSHPLVVHAKMHKTQQQPNILCAFVHFF
ncbi:MAG: hypothetical protein CMR00_04550 [[Chlorobium] sp. 445]|nr:MAG: hypothetical protein CMR00_04550 [[Chlorobium] sp. 445]